MNIKKNFKALLRPSGRIRRLLILFLTVYGVSRLDLLPRGTFSTWVPDWFYGIAFLLCSLLLFLFAEKRLTFLGRATAALTFGLLGGYIVEIARSSSCTSALVTAIVLYMAAIEVGSVT